MRARVYQRAFGLLRREFGATAHFWARPRFEEKNELPEDFRLDFYWRRANVGLLIVGPGERDKPGNLSVASDPGYFKRRPGISLVMVPYELIVREPQEFLRQLRDVLIASRKYPRLP